MILYAARNEVEPRPKEKNATENATEDREKRGRPGHHRLGPKRGRRPRFISRRPIPSPTRVPARLNGRIGRVEGVGARVDDPTATDRALPRRPALPHHPGARRQPKSRIDVLATARTPHEQFGAYVIGSFHESARPERGEGGACGVLKRDSVLLKGGRIGWFHPRGGMCKLLLRYAALPGSPRPARTVVKESPKKPEHEHCR